MPAITRVATSKLSELQIFGNDYDTHDGTYKRYINNQKMRPRLRYPAVMYLIKLWYINAIL